MQKYKTIFQEMSIVSEIANEIDNFDDYPLGGVYLSKLVKQSRNIYNTYPGALSFRGWVEERIDNNRGDFKKDFDKYIAYSVDRVASFWALVDMIDEELK
jgi:hypothetical protein